MNIGQALELAGKSPRAFEDKLHDIKLRELYELVDNLRFVDSPGVFNAAYKILIHKLESWYKFCKANEKGKEKEDVRFSFSWLRFEAHRQTDFDVFNANSPGLNLDIRPSEFFKSLIDEASGWVK